MADQAKHDDQIMQDLSKPRSPLDYLRLFFSGFAMGASDIVPGVSGGTMAFILGVYETLINGIKSFNIRAAQMAIGLVRPAEGEARTDLMTLVDHLHLRFLIALGTGILVAILALSSLLEHWLETQPTFVFAFFGGLIIASVVAIGAKVQWTRNAIIAGVVGTVGAFLIVGLPSLGDQLGHSYPILFVSGAIAICAMILPGISGSFILLILGQYDYVLSAVRSFDLLSLMSVAAGAVIGIVSFSRVLSWLLDRYENTTIALLVGFMLGSLRLIVYRATNLITEDEAGEELIEAIDLSTGDIGIALVFLLVGFLLVNLIDHMQSGDNPVFRLVTGKRTTPATATES